MKLVLLTLSVCLVCAGIMFCVICATSFCEDERRKCDLCAALALGMALALAAVAVFWEVE
jgi:hypothetical protein